MSEAQFHKSSPEKRVSGPGRPRNFDEAAALEAAMNVFWQKGFEATSLDDLTKAMGLSRSSFYGAFGDKQSLFLRAVEHYSSNGIRNLRNVAETAGGDPIDAMMQAISDPKGGPRGCLLVNCITELAPHDEKVAALGRRHLESIEEIFARALDPQNPDAVRDKARAYSSLAIGTLALRKAGIPADRIADTLKQARSVLSP
ncbi:TetR/AcrR family transcriptional regulator [Roseibium salinum]|uniref:TetR/AcrR family transcriptional regulator n=1 Tax=Roseibium salinum TaxID=1604349 RepID=A0ABT3R1J4_9HYPH|nr:TetR/AcrR family transcriptional regulator [Roseibium sp. DSM 29163]MCX2723088.1 TetR/AcrR family transcriptional regulator [Roseibium sp. DSM 29163]